MDELVKENINRYRSESYAQRYKHEYTQGFDFKHLRSRIIATREIAIIRSMLNSLCLDKNKESLVLDLPCGTGKLGQMLSEFPVRILAGDISKEMMALASAEYSNNQLLKFSVFDAQRMPLKDKSIDTIICLRLFQRLSRDIRINILREFQRVARHYIIISYSYDSIYQNFRRHIRNYYDKEKTFFFSPKLHDIDLELIKTKFSVQNQQFVLPGLSSETIILARA
jgi:ubiquinone/menaquinone biosynthesis C-methylase UbiE